MRRQLVATGDLDLAARDRCAQAFAGSFADFADLLQGDALVGRRGNNGPGQRMFRVTFHAGGRREDIPLAEAGRANLLGQLRFAVGERAGLVEDHGPAGVDLFQHHRVLDDDRTFGRKRDGADDRHRNGDQQRAGRGHHQHRQKAVSILADQPGADRDDHGQRRVQGPESIAQPTQLRTLLLRSSHHLHDLGVAGIDRELGGADRDRRFAVDGAGENLRTGSLRHLKGFSGQIRLVHHAVAFNNHAIDRADVVWIHEKNITDGDLFERHIDNFVALFAMGDRRRPFGERFENGRRVTHRVVFQRFAAGQHQHNQRAGEIFAHQNRGYDRNASQKIRAEFESDEFDEEFVNEGNPAEAQRGEQREMIGTGAGMNAKAQHEVRKDCRDGQHRDYTVLAVFENRFRLLGLVARHLNLSPRVWLCQPRGQPFGTRRTPPSTA